MNRRAISDPIADEKSTRIFYWWLLASIFCEYARPASAIPFLRIPMLYSLLPIILFVVTMFLQRGFRPAKEIFADPQAKWVLLFLLMMTASLAWGKVWLYAWNMIKLVMGYVILFWLIARIGTTQKRLRGIFLTLLVSHLFLLAMNPQIIMNPDVRNYIEGATFLGDGNDFSLSLCIMLPLTFELAMNAQNVLKKALWWSCAVILLFAIVASQSRGATIGLAAVLVYIWLYSTRKGAALVGVAFLASIVLIYAPPAYFSRMGTIKDYENEGSASARITAWKAAMRMATSNPLLGVGVGQFPSEFGGKYRPKDEPGGRWMTAHSSYFLVIAELGFTGIIIFLTLVVGGVVASLKVRAMVRARSGPDPPPAAIEGQRMMYLTTAALIGFAVPGAFLSAAYYPHIYVLTGILVCARANSLAAVGMTIPEAFPKKAGGTRRKPKPATSAATRAGRA